TMIDPAAARVFNMKKATVGSYLLFSGGNSVIKDQAFVGESVADAYDAEVNNNFSGEFGIFGSSESLSYGFGFEIIQPKALKEVVAKQNGTKIYTVDSTVQVYAPKVFIDLNLKTGTYYRVFLKGSAGYATAQIKNEYKAVSLAIGDHNVEMKGSAASTGIGLGVEFYLLDTTTMVISADYRILKFKDLRYGKEISTFQGIKTKGDSVTNTSESQREVDLSGAMATAGFRFYF
ncbi:MAG: hypothetical protein ACK5WZ_11535, partial [Pseudobdellovibrionaceae bacterium]